MVKNNFPISILSSHPCKTVMPPEPAPGLNGGNGGIQSQECGQPCHPWRLDSGNPCRNDETMFFSNLKSRDIISDLILSRLNSICCNNSASASTCVPIKLVQGMSIVSHLPKPLWLAKIKFLLTLRNSLIPVGMP